MKKFSSILKLLTWNNQSFPIGSYCFSSGLEYAVESKIIKTGNELQYWLNDLLRYGSLHSDALILLEACKLANKKEDTKINNLNNFAISLNQSFEKYIENYEQGKSFMKITEDAWNHSFINKKLVFPIAYAVAAVQENINREDILICYLHASLCNLLAAGIKLIPLGQTEGQKFQVK